MTLKLKVGKRYVRRDGKVTDPLIANPCESMHSFPFMDPKTQDTYALSGTIWRDEPFMEDLISEYKPAKPDWRVVIKCSTWTHARLIAALLKEKNPMAKITVEKSS